MSDNVRGWSAVDPVLVLLEDEILLVAGGFSLIRAGAPATRAEALAFIQHQFRLHFGACVVDDTPILMLCRDSSGAVTAAWGLRSLDEGLFSQRYLDQDVLDCLRTVTDAPPRADEVVELSHLSLRHPKALLVLIPLLAQVLEEMRFRYLVCTATGCMTRYFQRRGFSPVVLAAADRQRLAAVDRDSWGSYYDHNPMVLVGSIHSAVARKPSR